MAIERERSDRDSTRDEEYGEEQKGSRLPSTKEDASLADQVLGDSPHPGVHREVGREDRDRRGET